MLHLMGETKDVLKSTASKRWSTEAINFLKAMSFSTPDELSDVSVNSHYPELLLNPLIACVHDSLEWLGNAAASFPHWESCYKD